ncbi:MAG: hypothetical protein ACLRXH_03375 [Monoglobus pectinilyticus]|nr:hypothetical protein [Monoglobus pectinilyticus]
MFEKYYLKFSSMYLDIWKMLIAAGAAMEVKSKAYRTQSFELCQWI